VPGRAWNGPSGICITADTRGKNPAFAADFAFGNFPDCVGTFCVWSSALCSIILNIRTGWGQDAGRNGTKRMGFRWVLVALSRRPWSPKAELCPGERAAGVDMREGGGGCPWGRRAFASVPAIVAGLSMIPSSAPAQTELPPIDVIAPTPLAGSRIAKPKSTPSVQRARTVRAPGAPSQTAAAPVPGAAPSTTATSSGDPTGTARNNQHTGFRISSDQ